MKKPTKPKPVKTTREKLRLTLDEWACIERLIDERMSMYRPHVQLVQVRTQRRGGCG